jgi:acyl-CoA reductase-like NAD-dependent aldehyde dehydrogenase
VPNYNFSLTINGQAAAADDSFDVVNPASGEAFASAPNATSEHVEAAVRAARNAYDGWSKTPWGERRDALHAFAARIDADQNDLAELLVREQGKPLASAAGEVQSGIDYVRTLADIEIEDEVLRSTDHQRVVLRHRPLGVVSGITAWNYPIQLASSKLAMALATGNTTIIKPSPFTPLTTLRLGELGREVFPAGVFNVLSGLDPLGAQIVEHPEISKVGFTGSGPTGRAIMRCGADSLKRLTLELGGNDAAIVLDDVDVKATAKDIFASAFENSGQLCNAIKRLYVHESIYQDMVDELAMIARDAVIGDGLDPETQLGPIQNRNQYERVIGLLDDIRATGGEIVAGGGVPEGPGFFIEPTIVTSVAEGSRIVDEEPFGPILPIMSFSDVDEAVARANSSEFGLGGSVWSADVQRGEGIARRLEVGTAWVNQHSVLEPSLPSGGVKDSGVGVEYSKLGLLEYTVPQVINIRSEPS